MSDAVTEGGTDTGSEAAAIAAVEAVHAAAKAEETGAEVAPPETDAAPEAPAVEEPAPEAVKPEPQAAKLAAATIAEKKLQARREAFAKERETFEQERATAKAQLEAFEKAKAEASLNPLAYLEAAGLSIEKVNEFVLEGGKPSPELAARAEIERFRKEQQAEREKAAAEKRARLEAENAKAIAAYKSSAIDTVRSAGAQYELVNAFGDLGSYEILFSMIEQNYAATGKVMATEEAAEKLEAHLETLGRGTRKFAASASPPPSTGASPQAPVGSAKQSGRTLSNDLTATTAGVVRDLSTMTDEDRVEAAIAAHKAALVPKG